jgi:hypothetical protein
LSVFFMRGQVSLEYLVLALLALALISVSVFALANIGDYAERASGLFVFRSSAISLANAMDEVCALGSGNVRSVALEAPLNVEYEDNVVRISGYDSSVVRPSRCEIDAASGLEGRVYVKNEGGRVSVTKP